MDVCVLNLNGSLGSNPEATYEEGPKIPKWSSLIWTQRKDTPSDFQLKTANIEETLNLLPPSTPSVICELDSKEVMIVEDHSIENGVLTITGTCLLGFMNNRTLFDAYTDTSGFPYGPAVAVYDDWGLGPNVFSEDTVDNVENAEDKIPGFRVTLEYAPTEFGRAGYTYSLVDNLYPAIHKYIDITSNESGVRMTFRSIFKDDGKIHLVIYNDDVTNMAATDPSLSVTLSEEAGHIMNVKSLWSISSHKTNAYVLAKNGFRNVLASNLSEQPEGLERRVDIIDQTSNTKTGGPLQSELLKIGRDHLRDKGKVQEISFEVSKTLPYSYGQDYFMGSGVIIVPKYGPNKIGVVSEFIRSESKEGYFEYPGITLLDQ